MKTDISTYQVVEVKDGSWRESAVCRGRDPDSSVFFIEGGGSSTRHLEARSMCFVCPVRKECLEYAIINSLVDGIWGGFGYRDRLSIRSGRRSADFTTNDLISGYSSNGIILKKLSALLSIGIDEVDLLIKSNRETTVIKEKWYQQTKSREIK